MYKRTHNPHVMDFLRSIDARRQHCTPVFRGQSKNTCKEEPRIPHPDKRESRISERLPSWCPLDWFDPVYFNNMNISFRVLYVDAPIALPLPQHCNHLDPPPDWKSMPEAKFMEKYGEQVWVIYNLPSQEELRALNDDGRDNEEVGDGPDHRGMPQQPSPQPSSSQLMIEDW